jgi:hypothetical protein
MDFLYDFLLERRELFEGAREVTRTEPPVAMESPPSQS